MTEVLLYRASKNPSSAKALFGEYIYLLSCGSPSWAFDHYHRDVVPFPAVKLIALGSIVATPLGAPILTY